MKSSGLTIWTIGHSNQPLARLVELLRTHKIQVVADVRSRPYSRFAPQFNRQALAKALPEHDLRYLFLGKELGGKPQEPAFYLADGSLDPERFTARPEFQRGLKRLLGEAAHFRVSLMCSEADPLKCHRSLLLAPELVKRGVKVLHILPDGGLLEHREAHLPQVRKPRQLKLF
ncbi:MAG: DUF488 domain-containing protein [Deltaproteobacteria bacterium]|nr:DUF488 domain-containing protein [Deltaproteobacteria bacterium]